MNGTGTEPVAFVTGASSGLGRGLAVRLAQEGFSVGLAARRMERLDEVVGDIRDYGGKAVAFRCDVGDPQQVHAAIQGCETSLGPIDLLIANAGVGARTNVEELARSEVERVMQVNFLGTVYAVEAVLPGMLRRRSGHLVAVSSLAGYGGLPKTAAYSASKGAVVNFFESLRIDLKPQGVDVTVINPGYVRTELTSRGQHPRPFMLELDDAVERMTKAILRKRPALAFPFPIAHLAHFAQVLPRPVYDFLASRIRR